MPFFPFRTLDNSLFSNFSDTTTTSAIIRSNKIPNGVSFADDFTTITVDADFTLGADISSLPQIWDANSQFARDGVNESLFNIFDPLGIHYARVRLWVEPSNVPEATGSYGDLAHLILLADAIKQANWSYLLDFHYSDWWADPSQQNKPQEWADLSFPELTDMLYNYTYSTLATLHDHDVLPDMIQVGNEISHGFLWPDGSTANWGQFTTLLASAIQAIRDFEADEDLSKFIPIMIHYAPEMDMGGVTWFFSQLSQYNISFDAIGLSYYPIWHGSLTALNTTLVELANQYEYSIYVVETAFPFSSEWNDDHNNVFYTDTGPVTFPITPTGQREFLMAIIQIVAALPLNVGRGVFYWEPSWITPCIGGSPMENAGFFNFTNNLLEVYSSPLVNYSIPDNPHGTTTLPTDDDENPSNDDETLQPTIPGFSEILFIWSSFLVVGIFVINEKRHEFMISIP